MCKGRGSRQPNSLSCLSMTLAQYFTSASVVDPARGITSTTSRHRVSAGSKLRYPAVLGQSTHEYSARGGETGHLFLRQGTLDQPGASGCAHHLDWRERGFLTCLEALSASSHRVHTPARQSRQGRLCRVHTEPGVGRYPAHVLRPAQNERAVRARTNETLRLTPNPHQPKLDRTSLGRT